MQPQLVPLSTCPHSLSSTHPRIVATSASKTGNKSAQLSITPPVELEPLDPDPVEDASLSPVELPDPLDPLDPLDPDVADPSDPADPLEPASLPELDDPTEVPEVPDDPDEASLLVDPCDDPLVAP